MRNWFSPLVLIAFLCACSAPQTVSFPTEDGGVVYGDLYGEGVHAVVLAHGFIFNKESWSEQADVLSDNGFQVLAIDFRGYGKSHGGEQVGANSQLYLDVLAGARYLRTNGAKVVSVIGASMGGRATAQAAVMSQPGEIDGVVLLAAPPIAEPEKMQGRKLFIVAQGDSLGNGRLRLPGIQDQYERASDPKQLIVLEGSAHAQFIFKSEQGTELMKEILIFLRD